MYEPSPGYCLIGEVCLWRTGEKEEKWIWFISFLWFKGHWPGKSVALLTGWKNLCTMHLGGWVRLIVLVHAAVDALNICMMNWSFTNMVVLGFLSKLKLYVSLPSLHYHDSTSTFKGTMRGMWWWETTTFMWDTSCLINQHLWIKMTSLHALITDLHMKQGLRKIALKVAVEEIMKQFVFFQYKNDVQDGGTSTGFWVMEKRRVWKDFGALVSTFSESTDEFILSGWWWTCQWYRLW